MLDYPTLGQLATVDDPPCWAEVDGEVFYVTARFLDDHENWIVVGETKNWNDGPVYEIEQP